MEINHQLKKGLAQAKPSSNEWVQKPRTLFWEYLFLSKNSPLRKYLSAFEISESLNPFDFIEDTVFAQISSQQYQEKILPSSNPVDVDNYRALGAYIALFSWFGVTDLHKDNLIYKTVNQSVKIIPIDIECIFNDIHLPSETYLIPKTSEINPNVGLCKTIEALQADKNIENSLLVLDGYITYLNFLDTIRKKISDLIFKLEDINTIPIRSISRNSTEYTEYLNDSEKEPTKEIFDKSEVQQLKKNKIPFYFHYLRDHKVYYYRSSFETSTVSQASELYSSIHRSCRRQGVIPSREAYINLLEAGSLQIAKILFPKDYIGKQVSNGTEINVTENLININFVGHFNVECEK